MQTRLLTTKVSPLALQSARMIAALTGEKLYEAIERVLAAEACKLGLPVVKPPSAVAPTPGA